jgi:hypothetical protein
MNDFIAQVAEITKRRLELVSSLTGSSISAFFRSATAAGRSQMRATSSRQPLTRYSASVTHSTYRKLLSSSGPALRRSDTQVGEHGKTLARSFSEESQIEIHGGTESKLQDRIADASTAVAAQV